MDKQPDKQQDIAPEFVACKMQKVEPVEPTETLNKPLLKQECLGLDFSESCTHLTEFKHELNFTVVKHEVSVEVDIKPSMSLKEVVVVLTDFMAGRRVTRNMKVRFFRGGL